MSANFAPSTAFTGSRTLTTAQFNIVGTIAQYLAQFWQHHILVGCAAGADLAVRQAVPSALVFRASNYPQMPRKVALVRRSIAMVHTLSTAPAPRQLLAFPAAPCPAGIVPANRWQSGFTPSGTWSTAALAAGLGVPVTVFFVPPAQLPAWAGSWLPVTVAGYTGYQYQPAATQTALF